MMAENRDFKAPDAQDDVTRILQSAEKPEDIRRRLLPLVYDQLRSIAQNRMREERADHTLEATALVHEAFLRLLGNCETDWQGRAHFYATAAQAMRRILIDHARAKGSTKRGGDRDRVPLSSLNLAAEPDLDDLQALDAALDQLETEDERAAQIVHLRFFAGLSVEETAEVLNSSTRTVARNWTFARARLYQIIRENRA